MGRPRRLEQEQLLAMARRLFADRGYEGTTLEEIAVQLGVTAAALVKRTGSKQKLFMEAMNSAQQQELPPGLDALADVPKGTDPLQVLGRLAADVIPFLEQKIQQNIVLMMHLGRSDREGTGALAFPTGEASPPARALTQLETYFRRLKRAGVLKLTDPRAAALLFLGSLQSYVFLHRVLRVASPPFPLSRFIAQLMQLWSEGGVVSPDRGVRTKPRRSTEHRRTEKSES